MSLLPTSTRLGTAIVSSDAITESSCCVSMPRAAPARPDALRCWLMRTSSLVPSAARPRASRSSARCRARWFHRLARIGIAEARPGIEDHQRARHRRVVAMERERHVAAQRQSADHRTLDAAGRAGWLPCPRRWRLRNRRRGRPGSRFGRGRACPTRSPGTDRAALRSGRPTCGRWRCSRARAGSAGLAHAPRNGSPRRRDRASPWPISSAPTAA